MIALKLTDESNSELELSLQPSFNNDSKECVMLQLSGDNNEDEQWRTNFFYFENASELNSYITFLVGMKKHLKD